MIREYIVKISDEVMDEIIADHPQELIRCKNCRKRREWFCELDGKYHSPEFFCGFAKPKDGG